LATERIVSNQSSISPTVNDDASLLQRRAARSYRWAHSPFAKMLRTTAAFAVFAWWSGSHLAGQPYQPQSNPPTITTSPIPDTAPASPANAAKGTVQVRNSFDATEVFEFPAGTSDVVTRQKVAEVLLQRARARRSQWSDIRPTPISLRTANLYAHRKQT
jgi:hypothetical protein